MSTTPSPFELSVIGLEGKLGTAATMFAEVNADWVRTMNDSTVENSFVTVAAGSARPSCAEVRARIERLQAQRKDFQESYETWTSEVPDPRGENLAAFLNRELPSNTDARLLQTWLTFVKTASWAQSDQKIKALETYLSRSI